MIKGWHQLIRCWTSVPMSRICLQAPSSFELSGNPQAIRVENKTSLDLPEYRRTLENITYTKKISLPLAKSESGF